MKPRLFTTLSALSLVLLMALMALWVRSQFLSDHAVFTTRVGPEAYTGCTLRLYTGYVGIWVNHYRYPATGQHAFATGACNGRTDPLYSWTVDDYRPARNLREPWRTRSTWNLGMPSFRWERDPRTSIWDVQGVTAMRATADIPFWTLALACSFLPLAWFFSQRQTRKRARRNLCPSCGYDLRFTPDRCPECGATPAKAST